MLLQYMRSSLHCHKLCCQQVKGAECVVLAGDPLQLPPTVLSRRAGAEFRLTTTMFERLQAYGGSRHISVPCTAPVAGMEHSLRALQCQVNVVLHVQVRNRCCSTPSTECMKALRNFLPVPSTGHFCRPALPAASGHCRRCEAYLHLHSVSRYSHDLATMSH